MWWKQNKWKVILPIAAIVILAIAFWYGGDAPGLQGWTAEPPAAAEPAQTVPAVQTPEPDASVPPVGTPSAALEDAPEPTPSAVPADIPEPTPSAAPEDAPGPTPSAVPENTPAAPPAASAEATPDRAAAAYSEANGMDLDPDTGKDPYGTDPAAEGQPLPAEPQDAEIGSTAYTCTMSISCAAILDHMDWLDPEKAELVPEDGVILPAAEVTFYEGESVFNVLQRTCKQNRVHLEFSTTPMYNSAYVEGIHNLYEFDCGEQSGWVYSVNGWFPNYGCSRYQLQDGDVVAWLYTCNLGVDVGGQKIGG